MRLKSAFGGSGKLGGRQVWWAEQSPALKKYIHDPTPRTCDCYLIWLKKKNNYASVIQLRILRWRD